MNKDRSPEQIIKDKILKEKLHEPIIPPTPKRKLKFFKTLKEKK